MKDTKSQRSWIEIDLSAFAHNLSILKSYLPQGQEFLQVVKADAYGHGAYQIAKVALENGAVMLGVANVEEAVLLRYQGIDAPILILSPSLHSEVDLIVEHNIIPSVSDLSMCERLNTHCRGDALPSPLPKKLPVHIKIDTGMNRNGVRWDEFEAFLSGFAKCKHLVIEGLFSHFAASDDDEEFSVYQQELFVKCVDIFKSDRFSHINKDLKYVHIANSVGSVRKYESCINLARYGIMSYGYTPSIDNGQFSIEPVMSYKSRISHISTAKAGETIGYNRTYKVSIGDFPIATQNCITYAIIPVGYADGYDYLLSNKGYVLIHNIQCPILGKVSMDMICVDVTSIPDAQLNDEVLLLGNDNGQSTKKGIAATELVGKYGGSVYELLCQLGRRAKRYYFKDGHLIDDDPLQRRAFIPKDFSSDKLNHIIQQAIAHRIQSDELSAVLYQDILQHLFYDSDREISYRSDFKYDIEFSQSDISDFYAVKTTLSYKKVLQNDEFTIVCANDNEALQYYFRQKNCEYRWLLDKSLSLTPGMFQIVKVTINGHIVSANYHKPLLDTGKTLVYHLSDHILSQLKGTEAHFHIEIQTLYPKNSHQLAVYINEITKGVEVSFTYPPSLFEVQTSTIFSGRERFAEVSSSQCPVNRKQTITIKTHKDTWVFPTSGVVFSFTNSTSNIE